MIYEGRIIRVSEEQCRLPNGVEFICERVWHPGGAAIVVLDDQGRVCLLRHYRAIAEDYLWELPAGKIDPGEDPANTAARELAEEVGVQAENWQSLGSIYSSPGVFDERVHLYLAHKLSAVAAAHDPDEVFDIHWLAYDEALQMADHGKISDAKTLAGLYRARTLAASVLEGDHEAIS